MTHSEASTDIAIFALNLELGGAERMIVTVANAMAERGYTVDLVLSDLRGPYISDVGHGVRVVPLGAGRLRRSVRPLREYLKRSRPKVLYSTLVAPNVIAAISTLGLDPLPRLVLKESSVPSRARANYSWAVRASYVVAPLLYRRADAIVAGSAGVATELTELLGVPTSRIHVVHNPSRLPLGVTSPEPPHPWLEGERFEEPEPWCPRANPVVVSVGRVTRLKGIDRLLRALALHDDLRNTRALILGDGPARPELEALTNSLRVTDRVQFVGRVSEPREWLIRADALVVTSHFESWGNVLIESLQVGTPVVSVDCPYGPGEILDGGRFGTLVQSTDPSAIGEAIAKALSKPPNRSELRERAAMFSLDRTVDQLIKVFDLEQ